MGRSSEKFPRTSGWRSVERGAEHLGLGWGRQRMPWLVRIAGMKETRRTVHVRMVVVIHPALQSSGTKKLKNEVTYLVGLRLSRALSKTNDKVEFCLGVYVILGGGKEKACSFQANRLRLCLALFRRAAHWSHFSIQHFRGLRLQYS